MPSDAQGASWSGRSHSCGVSDGDSSLWHADMCTDISYALLTLTACWAKGRHGLRHHVQAARRETTDFATLAATCAQLFRRTVQCVGTQMYQLEPTRNYGFCLRNHAVLSLLRRVQVEEKKLRKDNFSAYLTLTTSRFVLFMVHSLCLGEERDVSCLVERTFSRSIF